MNSLERLQQEIKTAMLARDPDRLSALRLLKSAVGYTQIEKKTETLSESDFVAVVQKEVKKRRDSIEQFEKGGRPELAEKERKEISVLEQFLPKALAPEELEQLVKATIQELGATRKKWAPSSRRCRPKLPAARTGRASARWLGSCCRKRDRLVFQRWLLLRINPIQNKVNHYPRNRYVHQQGPGPASYLA